MTLMNQAAGEERRAAIHQRHVQRLCKRQVVPQPRWGVWDTPASCPFVLRPRVARPDFGRDFESKNGKRLRNFENGRGLRSSRWTCRRWQLAALGFLSTRQPDSKSLELTRTRPEQRSEGQHHDYRPMSLYDILCPLEEDVFMRLIAWHESRIANYREHKALSEKQLQGTLVLWGAFCLSMHIVGKTGTINGVDAASCGVIIDCVQIVM